MEHIGLSLNINNLKNAKGLKRKKIGKYETYTNFQKEKNLQLYLKDAQK